MKKPIRPKKPDSLKGRKQRAESSKYFNIKGVKINLSDTYNLEYKNVCISDILDEVDPDGGY
jgi:hypothetical protein